MLHKLTETTALAVLELSPLVFVLTHQVLRRRRVTTKTGKDRRATAGWKKACKPIPQTW